MPTTNELTASDAKRRTEVLRAQDEANTLRQQVEILHRLVELGFNIEEALAAVKAGDLSTLKKG